MNIRRTPTVVLGVWRLSLTCVLLCTGCLAQTKIDVSQCFSEELVTHVTQNIAMNFLYNYLAVIDEKTYSKVQANSSATALLPAGLFSGDWNGFQEARRNYFRLHSE